MKLFVTYGNDTRLSNSFSVVEAATLAECHQILAEVTKGKYAFSYNEKAFQGQQEKWHLDEVPLQACSAYEGCEES